VAKGELELLEALRAQIPTFQCKPGCQDCCGLIIWSRTEWQRAASHPAGQCIGPDTSLSCEYQAHEGERRCAIYSERPILCRLFGASQEKLLKCPHGCKPKQPLTIKETRRIVNHRQLKQAACPCHSPTRIRARDVRHVD